MTRSRKNANKDKVDDTILPNPLASRPLNYKKNPFSSWFGPEFRPIYLFVYNGLSMLGWLFVAGIISGYVKAVGLTETVNTVHQVVAGWIQLLTFTACLEILHAAVGLVKSRVVTTAMQCIVRFLVVTIFSNGLAVDEVRYHWSYAAMVGAWTISEIVRYSYYLFDSAPAGAPLTMIWCRYSFFIVLYPIGALGEALQMYQGLDVVKERFGIIAYYVTILVLILYPTGLGIMYSHMLKQRKKHLTAAYEMEARVQQAVAEYQQSKQK